MTQNADRRESPERTCVGCRTRDAVERLLRVAVVAGRVVPDPRRRLPGRGAYVHVSSSAGVPAQCVERAVRRGGLARALRVEVRDRDVVALREAAGLVAARVGVESSQVKGQSR